MMVSAPSTPFCSSAQPALGAVLYGAFQSSGLEASSHARMEDCDNPILPQTLETVLHAI